jgi:putative endopeptidase
MSPETRGRAIDKVRQMQIKIAYPDEWMDYSGLDIRRGNLMRNVLGALRFWARHMLDKVGTPSDRSQWAPNVPPQEVNAFYRMTANDIHFPAGLLQPPFFDADADAATNFGALGTLVGHEMTHGFDYSGRHFDGLGNLKEWWSAADAAEYEKRLAVQIQHAEAFTLYGKPVNGTLTAGENIADLGGLKLAYRAFEAYLSEQAEEPPRISGLTARQRFFLSFANTYRANVPKGFQLLMLTHEEHAPFEYRVNGPLQNLGKAFYDAFGVQEGDPMYLPPEERIDIW